MKKIITAIGNNKLAEELKKKEIFEIVTRDIPYKEGVIEVLIENKNIDTLIVSEILDGEISFKEMIEQILRINEKIEIIVFVEEKNADIQNFLFTNGIYKIYQNNEVDLETFINSLANINVNDLDSLNIEMEKIHIRNKEKNNYDNLYLEARGKVIALSGAYNSGKSVLTCILAEEYAKQGKKTLIVDFDIYNASINTLLGISKYTNKDMINIENQIIHVSKNLDAICAMDLLFNNNNTVDYINLEQMIINFKVDYDVVVIDTTSDYKYKYLPRILNIADGIVFLMVPSIVELKKSNNLLEVLLEDLKIDNKKIQIVLNKVNNYSLDNMVINKMFSNMKITGNVKYDEKIEKQKSLMKITEMIGE
ncbi:MAG: tyrosine-protein kinase family protein [Clostridia bacterium]|nr:tyrosine-protein kinase family protein [Clostridia bacterium]